MKKIGEIIIKKLLLERSIKTFLTTMIPLFTREYIIDSDVHFTRKGKMTYIDYIKYIIWNNGRNNDIEISEFFKVFLNKKYETISSQAIGKQRVFINV